MLKPGQVSPHYTALLLLLWRKQLSTREIVMRPPDKACPGTRSLPCLAEPFPSKIAL
jgi:hypothetical protein